MLKKDIKNIFEKEKCKCFMMINKEAQLSKNLIKAGNKSLFKKNIQDPL